MALAEGVYAVGHLIGKLISHTLSEHIYKNLLVPTKIIKKNPFLTGYATGGTVLRFAGTSLPRVHCVRMYYTAAVLLYCECIAGVLRVCCEQ